MHIDHYNIVLKWQTHLFIQSWDMIENDELQIMFLGWEFCTRGEFCAVVGYCGQGWKAGYLRNYCTQWMWDNITQTSWSVNNRTMNVDEEVQEYLHNIFIEPWVKNFEGQSASTSTRLTADISIQSIWHIKVYYDMHHHILGVIVVHIMTVIINHIL